MRMSDKKLSTKQHKKIQKKTKKRKEKLKKYRMAKLLQLQHMNYKFKKQLAEA